MECQNGVRQHYSRESHTAHLIGIRKPSWEPPLQGTAPDETTAWAQLGSSWDVDLGVLCVLFFEVYLYVRI